MRKIQVLFGVVAALCLMAFSASAASAAGINNGPTSFTGSGHGTHSFSIGSAVAVRCSVTNSGTINAAPTDAHGHRTTAQVNMSYTGCTATIFGFPAAAATVTDNNNWRFTVTGFNPATGAGTATINTGFVAGNTVISVPSLGCTITVPGQTVNITTQNVTAADTNSPANGAPAGVHIIANDNTITGTSSGCFGVPSSFTNATYSGVKHENGVWGVD